MAKAKAKTVIVKNTSARLLDLYKPGNQVESLEPGAETDIPKDTWDAMVKGNAAVGGLVDKGLLTIVTE